MFNPFRSLEETLVHLGWRPKILLILVYAVLLCAAARLLRIEIKV